MANPSDFLFNSDYPIDQVVYMTTMSITIESGSYGTSVTQDHGLPFRPLATGNWSTDSNFSTQVYQVGSSRQYSSGAVQVDVLANDTEIQVIGVNMSSSSVTVYLHIFCFAPADWDGEEIETTASDSNVFILSTDYNYCKLIQDGYIDIAQGGTGTVAHGVSQIPQAMVWYVNTDGYTHQQEVSVVRSGATTPEFGNGWYSLDDTNLTIVDDGIISGTHRYYYRIYGD